MGRAEGRAQPVSGLRGASAFRAGSILGLGSALPFGVGAGVRTGFTSSGRGSALRGRLGSLGWALPFGTMSCLQGWARTLGRGSISGEALPFGNGGQAWLLATRFSSWGRGWAEGCSRKPLLVVSRDVTPRDIGFTRIPRLCGGEGRCRGPVPEPGARRVLWCQHTRIALPVNTLAAALCLRAEEGPELRGPARKPEAPGRLQGREGAHVGLGPPG